MQRELTSATGCSATSSGGGSSPSELLCGAVHNVNEAQRHIQQQRVSQGIVVRCAAVVVQVVPGTALATGILPWLLAAAGAGSATAAPEEAPQPIGHLKMH